MGGTDTLVWEGNRGDKVMPVTEGPLQSSAGGTNLGMVCQQGPRVRGRADIRRPLRDLLVFSFFSSFFYVLYLAYSHNPRMFLGVCSRSRPARVLNT